MATAIVMPKAGNSVEECVLSKWRIKVGDTIKAGDIIADIETDKSAIEVEATAGGQVLALFANEGDRQRLVDAAQEHLDAIISEENESGDGSPQDGAGTEGSGPQVEGRP